MSSDQEVNHRKRRRNRMRVSCLNCYASKRKCDRKRPCTRCIKHGLTGLCVYELDDPETRDSASDETSHLRNRIAELESVIRGLNNRPHPRWFASNGLEHVPELVATRRPTGSNRTTAEDSTSLSPTPSKTFKTPPGNLTLTSPNSVRAGFKRKHDDLSTKNKLLSQSDASFNTNSKKTRHTGSFNNDGGSNDASKSAHTTYNSDDSYCTDEDDDENDEDYAEYRSRSHSKPGVSVGRLHAAISSTPKRAYSRSNSSSSGAPSLRSSTSRSISTSSSNPPSTPSTAFSSISLASHNQSALGLIFDDSVRLDGSDNGDMVDASASADVDDPSPTKAYSLRANVFWNDQSETADHQDADDGARANANSSAHGSGPAGSSTSRSGVKLLIDTGRNHPSTSESKRTAGSTSTSQKKEKKSVVKENNGKSLLAAQRQVGRYVDTAVQTSETALDSKSATANSGSCSCHNNIEIRNEITFLVATLGDISNILKEAHEIDSGEGQASADGGIDSRCELFRRIVELDDYFSSTSQVALTMPTHTHTHTPSSESRDSTATPSLSIYADLATEFPVSATINIPPTPLLPAPTPASILERSVLSQAQAPSRLPPFAVDVATPKLATVTLASVLADTLSPGKSCTRTADYTPGSHKSGVVTGLPVPQPPPPPPRLFRTPDPTPTVSLTPAFSPSSPIIRPANSAMRRPDADFLPFYSYALAHGNETQQAEHDHNSHRDNVGGAQAHSSNSSHTHIDHLVGHGVGVGDSPVGVGVGVDVDDSSVLKMDMDIARIRNTAIVIPDTDNIRAHDQNLSLKDHRNVQVGVDVDHGVSIQSSSLALRKGNNGNAMTMAAGMNVGMDVSMVMDMDIDVNVDVDADAEGEPAPESGYQYGYFEDGYRYQYVCIED